MSKNSSKLIQHLGIVAGICDEVQLIQQIDQRIPPNKREVSVGQAVQAMILNALGLSGRAVYLIQDFTKAGLQKHLLEKESQRINSMPLR